MLKKFRRVIATFLSVLLVGSVVLPVRAVAQHADEVPIDALSYAYGGQLDLRLLEGLLSGDGLSVAELNGTDQSWIDGVSPIPQPQANQELNLEALQLINLNLGTLDLPLVGPGGLLEFALDEATLGAVHEFANAKNPNEAYGAVGLVGSDGSTVDLTKGGEGDPYASINILSLLNLQQSEAFTTEVLNKASLELGVLGSKAERHSIEGAAEALCTGMNKVDYSTLDHPELNHPILGQQYFTLSDDLKATGSHPGLDDNKFCTDYRIADAKIVIDAPIIKDLMELIETEVGRLDTVINSALGADGLLNGVLTTVGELLKGVLSLLNTILGLLGISVLDVLELSVTANLPIDDIIDDLVLAPLSDTKGFVAIDLKEGTIEIDLQQVHGGDLSNLAPNTPLLTGTQINEIADSVTSLLTDSKSVNPNGLMARLENTLRGNSVTKTGGLYETEVTTLLELEALSVENALYSPLFPLLGPEFYVLGEGSLTVSGTLGQLLGDSQSDFTITGTGSLSIVDLLGGVITELATGVGGILEVLLFTSNNGGPSIISSLVGSVASNSLVSGLIDSLTPLLVTVLGPVANAIINRQSIEKIPQGNLFTVSALELNVLTLSGNVSTNQTEDRLVGLPIGTSAVLAQHWDLIDLDLNVAKIGDGQGLHTSGYTYDLVCEADRWTGIDATDADHLEYDEENVGTGFFYATNQLALTGVTAAGLNTPLQALPGSVCTVTTNPPLTAHEALRPTGNSPTRAPYTYFLAESPTGPLVSGATPTNQATLLETNGVTVGLDNQVAVDATSVGDEWKSGSFTFTIPTDATSHKVNIVHAYDIDTRDIVVTKGTDGPVAAGAAFNFQYSLDGGATWVPNPAHAVTDGGTFTIPDVPLIDSTTLLSTSVLVREEVPTPAAGGPEVSWSLDGTGLPAGTHNGAYAQSTSFNAGFGITALSTTTPDLALNVINAYPVSVNFEAMLPATGVTTLVWILGLGLLIAIGALVLFIRSRK